MFISQSLTFSVCLCVSLTYQFIEGGVVIIADHLCFLLGALVRVGSQTCDHVGVGVRAICLLLLKEKRRPPSSLTYTDTS